VYAPAIAHAGWLPPDTVLAFASCFHVFVLHARSRRAAYGFPLNHFATHLRIGTRYGWPVTFPT